MKLERLEDVDRAFVHVDYETQHAPEHKKVSVPSSAHTLPSTREHYNPTSPRGVRCGGTGCAASQV